MTNADWIRAMSDEELANNIMCPHEICGGDVIPCEIPRRCTECCLKWLKQIYEDGKE